MMTEARKTIAPVGESIGLKAASEFAKVDERTMRRWHKTHGLGFKRGTGHNAPLQFPMLELAAFTWGQQEALEQLRNGNHEHESVAQLRTLLALFS
ncbi:MAG TPA: hypothetical protein VGN93_06235 [Shinella sp.]|jgi:hypothetical protein|uniref:hypothetical protein n=1 Tax=Shinella sp. TaxID=1870904 RepID=UPI002E0FA6A0|nr:hypothetical protein [Shinella sp.]